jgi:hypothetical protein
MSAEAVAVFWTVVGIRFVLPLFIPRFPLPAILGALIIDAADQTIFQTFGFDPPGYQGYDKAMDVYYLAVAYISTLRNWTSLPALRISRFLFFYRMVGVVAFELLQLRWLLMVFPNTFEYFFIAYEGIRSRWNPLRFGARFWLITAAAIWIFIKLPQEYWIHVAQLDFTDTVRDVPWFGPLIVVGIVAGLAIFWFLIRPRLAPADWSWRFAADAVPAEIDEPSERAAWIRSNVSVWSWVTFEQVALVGLISVIYGRVLPNTEISDLRLFIGIAVLVVINAAWSVFWARREVSLQSVVLSGLARFAFTAAVVWLFDLFLGQEGGTIGLGDALFFVALLSLLLTLHARYRPVAGVRFGNSLR